VKCKRSSHPGRGCQQAKEKKEDKDIEFDDFKLDKEAYARCASCKIPLEKVEGCNKVDCVQCRHITCWICKDDITDLGYSHFGALGNGVFSFISGKGGCKLWTHTENSAKKFEMFI
jgi:hypothetical protein